MPDDESKFVHGRIYHRLFDPPLTECRRVVVDLVAEGSSVLDIACGTGELCFSLCEEKHCRVAGIDLSRRQLDFREFLAGGGIQGLLKDSPPLIITVHRSLFWHNCREVVVLSGREEDNRPEKGRQK